MNKDNDRPSKPWETARASSGPTPFKPPTPGSTSETVDKSGTANPGEIVPTTDRAAATNVNSIGRPLPRRPWEQQQPTYGNTYGGGYGSGYNYNSGLGSSLYGPYGGGYNGSYNSGGWQGNMYRNGLYGGGGGSYGGSGMYGGGMFNSGGYGGGYGMGMGGPFEGQDPNNPHNPSSPPGFWMTFLRMMQGVVNCFGRISVLIDQNTQAFHIFMTALLQVFDRSGLLYWELAGFVLRLLGMKSKRKKEIDGGGTAGGPGWDNLWNHNKSG